MTIFFPCEGFLTWLLLPAIAAAPFRPDAKLFPPNDSLLFVPGWWCWDAILSSVKELVRCNDGGQLLELLNFGRLRFGGVLKLSLLCLDDEVLDSDDDEDDRDEFEQRLLSFRFLEPFGGKLLLFDPLPLTDIQKTKRHETRQTKTSPVQLPTSRLHSVWFV